MKQSDFDKLNNVFDIETVEVKQLEAVKVEKISTGNEDKEDDFKLARDTLVNLIHKNDDVIDNLIHLAKNSETARTYEVAGQLLKTQAEIAKGLMDLHKQKKDVDGESSQNIKQQNNIVFAGSTNDLMKLLNDKQK